MQRQEIPFNISLLNLTPELLRGIRPITSLDIYDANNNFHTDGLYSSEIFGKVGDTSRDRKFSYIDIGVKIFHPQIYKTLGKLKQMYTGILEGKIYAVWDDKIKDFVKSNPIDGQTGMWFFMTYWTEIKFEHNASTQRDDYIRLIEKYKNIVGGTIMDEKQVKKILLKDLRSPKVPPIFAPHLRENAGSRKFG